MLADSLKTHLSVQHGYTVDEIETLLSGTPIVSKGEEIPQIMESATEFLRQSGHECVAIKAPRPYKFYWCARVKCEFLEMMENAEAEDEKEMERFNSLVEEGHTCLVLLETFPCQVGWCEEKVCVKNPEKKKKKRSRREWLRKPLPERACKTKKNYSKM